MDAIKTRKLKKPPSLKLRRSGPPSPRLWRAGADFEVDFFFMVDVELFPLCGEPETVPNMLGETLKRCQHIFHRVSLAEDRRRKSASHHPTDRRRDDHSVIEASPNTGSKDPDFEK